MIVGKRKAERGKELRRARERREGTPEGSRPEARRSFDPEGGNGGRTREGRRTRTRRFERRKTYETKLPYERWEAGQVWKAALGASEGPRRKANQGGRSGWIRGKLEEEARGLRYYETQPREYRTRFQPRPEREAEAGPEGTQAPKGEGWGFWKEYEAEEAKRVRRWKKAIVQKKTVASGRNPRLPWDRGGREGGAGREARVTRTQARRRVRDGGKPGTPVERTWTPGETPRRPGKGRGAEAARRTLGGEAVEAPEPLGPRGGRPPVPAEGEVTRTPGGRRREEAFWTHLGKPQTGRYTSRRAQAGVPALGGFHPEEEVERRDRLEAEVVPRLTRQRRAKKGERDPSQVRRLEEERTRKRREVDEIFEDRTWKTQGEVRWNPYRKRVRRYARRRELREEGRRALGPKEKEKEGGERVGAGVVDWARLENEKSGMTRRFESYPTRGVRRGSGPRGDGRVVKCDRL